MINENMTNEQKANLDHLIYFLENNIPVHIKLLKTDKSGNHIFINGLLKSRYSESLFILNERVLGEIRISIFEIKPNGVEVLK